MLKFFRKNALAVIVITTGILSLIFVHVLPGLYGKVGEERYYIKTLYLAFGGAKMQVTTPDFTTMVAMQGGLSYFGLISVVMNVAGITFAIISIKVRHLTLDYYGAVFMVISGVSMLLLFKL